jgi:hypothetical protein
MDDSADNSLSMNERKQATRAAVDETARNIDAVYSFPAWILTPQQVSYTVQ